MIGMYLSMVMVWTEHFFPLYDAPRDGTLVWSLLIWTVPGAFILTGFAGILIDRLAYRGGRERGASPQLLMIPTLGIALILRAVVDPNGMDWRRCRRHLRLPPAGGRRRDRSPGRPSRGNPW